MDPVIGKWERTPLWLQALGKLPLRREGAGGWEYGDASTVNALEDALRLSEEKAIENGVKYEMDKNAIRRAVENIGSIATDDLRSHPAMKRLIKETSVIYKGIEGRGPFPGSIDARDVLPEKIPEAMIDLGQFYLNSLSPDRKFIWPERFDWQLFWTVLKNGLPMHPSRRKDGQTFY